MLYRLFRFIFKVFFSIFYRVKVIGAHNIPKEGGVLLCSNHIHLLDPPFVGSFIERKVHYMAKAELFKIPVIGWLITQFGAFPVKRGGVSKETIKLSLSILKDGKVMGIFPEGTRNASGSEAKKGAALFALRSDAAVVPVAIVTDYKLFRPLVLMYGKPLDLTEFKEAGAAGMEPATDYIMNAIRKMIAEYRTQSK